MSTLTVLSSHCKVKPLKLATTGSSSRVVCSSGILPYSKLENRSVKNTTPETWTAAGFRFLDHRGTLIKGFTEGEILSQEKRFA